MGKVVWLGEAATQSAQQHINAGETGSHRVLGISSVSGRRKEATLNKDHYVEDRTVSLEDCCLDLAGSEAVDRALFPGSILLKGWMID